MFNPYPSTASKAFIIDRVYEELGRAGYDFDVSPEEQISTLAKLDLRMATLAAEGVELNYNFPSSLGGGDPSDAAGVPDFAIETIAILVAERVAPGFGKSMSVESRKAKAEGLAFLRAQTATIPSMAYPRTTARGIGNKPWATWRPFFNTTFTDTITLSDIVAADVSALAGDWATTISGFADGAVLSLDDDVGGKYTLTGNLLQGTGLTAGTDQPIISQTYPGATNSPFLTTLNIAVS